MEAWERELIIKNLPELLMITAVNKVMLAFFQSNDILSRADIEHIDVEVSFQNNLKEKFVWHFAKFILQFFRDHQLKRLITCTKYCFQDTKVTKH